MRYILLTFILCSACSTINYTANGKLIDSNSGKISYFYVKGDEEEIYDNTFESVENNLKLIDKSKSVFIFPVKFGRLQLDDRLAADVQRELHFNDIQTESAINAQIEFEEVRDKLGCNGIKCYFEIAGALGVDYLLKIDIIRTPTVTHAAKTSNGTDGSIKRPEPQQKLKSTTLMNKKGRIQDNILTIGYTAGSIVALMTVSMPIYLYPDESKPGSQKELLRRQDTINGVMKWGLSTTGIIFLSTVLYHCFY